MPATNFKIAMPEPVWRPTRSVGLPVPVTAQPIAVNQIASSSYSFMGNWDPSVYYTVGSQVSYNSGYWLATAQNQNQAPFAGSSYWQPVSQPNILVRKQLANNVSVGASSPTVIDSLSVTMPQAGGPWWVRVDYFYAKNGGVDFIGWVEDSDGISFGASQGVTANNNSAISSSCLSPVSYQNGEPVTFDVHILDLGNATIVTSTAGEASAPVKSITIPSFMQLIIQNAP